MQPGSDCYFHPNERALATDFRQCLECGHSYRTEQELRDAARVYMDGPAPPADQIWACPTCAHDF
jgi:hypothetical protein